MSHSSADVLAKINAVMDRATQGVNCFDKDITYVYVFTRNLKK